MVLCGVLAIAFLVAAVVLIHRQQPTGKLALAGSVLLFVAAVILRPVADVPVDLDATRLEAQVPKQEAANGYISSKACRDCHPDQHASWSRSFHRTMTQVVTPETMAAPAEEFRSNLHGRDFHFFAENDRFFIDVVDPDWDAERVKVGLTTISENESPPYVRRQVVMSTGSHHYQSYWINGAKGNRLWRAPWMYHIQRERWIPLLDTFIAPPANHRFVQSWNDSCIHCHSVAGEPGRGNTEIPRTTMGEAGIACESCHGPGKKHVENQQRLLDSGRPDSKEHPWIVNPARLDHRRSSEVCGQCHSLTDFDSTKRRTFVPGDKLADSVVVSRYEDEHVQQADDLRDSYWADGTMRVAGREFSALQESACYQKGELSCLTCHSMHRFEDRDDQLALSMRTDAACLKCHETFAANVSAHTHHDPDSAGSRCYNCHMPHTSFGIFKAIRSHRIDSPTSAMTLKHGRPNACILCHTDQTMPRIDQKLVDWYGHEPAVTSELAAEISPAIAFLVSGDAIQRAVLAWNFGRKETREASGEDWQLPILAELLNDPYPVVRAVAGQTISEYPGTETFRYDFLAPADERQTFRKALIKLWETKRSSSGLRQRLADQPLSRFRPLMLKQSGERDTIRLQKLMQFRDDREIYFAE